MTSSTSDPDPPSLNPRIYTTAQLEQIAAEFLRVYHKPLTAIPIDIELILERDLDISILPFSSLKTLHGIEAFITLSRKRIYVDPFLMDLDQNEKRYRFTLAEEASHAILHKDLFKNVWTPEDYIGLYDKLGGETYRWMDRNAKYLAGAILMPAPLFEEKAGELFNRLKPDRFDSPMSMHVNVIEQLADLFQASQLSAGIRFQNLGLDRRLRLP